MGLLSAPLGPLLLSGGTVDVHTEQGSADDSTQLQNTAKARTMGTRRLGKTVAFDLSHLNFKLQTWHSEVGRSSSLKSWWDLRSLGFLYPPHLCLSLSLAPHSTEPNPGLIRSVCGLRQIR